MFGLVLNFDNKALTVTLTLKIATPTTIPSFVAKVEQFRRIFWTKPECNGGGLTWEIPQQDRMTELKKKPWDKRKKWTRYTQAHKTQERQKKKQK